MKTQFLMAQTWLQCISCGQTAYLLAERKFKCPSCDGLFDVMHNFKLLGKTVDELVVIFDARANPTGAGNTDDPKRKSGVWRFKEWIMPYLPDKHIVSLGEGNVPIVKAGRHLMDWVGGDIDLHLILEGLGPTGSFKDFGGTVMMSVAKAMGIKAVGCASTGDTSAMAAAYAAAAGIKCFVILPKGKVTPVQLAQPLVHGAMVITLPGSFDDCMEVMQELVRDYGAFPANSLNSTRIEGHQATVFLTVQYFGWKLPDWFAVPIGNGSNSSSVGKALRLLTEFGMPNYTKILGCQSRAANPLAKSWGSVRLGNFGAHANFLNQWRNLYQKVEVGETTATAARIGDPVSRNKVMREIVNSEGAMQVAEEEDLNEAVAICGKDGYFVCPQTGIALAGVRNAVRKGWIKKGERVVVVSTATGLKFTDSAAANLEKNIINAGNCKPETVAKILGL